MTGEGRRQDGRGAVAEVLVRDPDVVVRDHVPDVWCVHAGNLPPTGSDRPRYRAVPVNASRNCSTSGFAPMNVATSMAYTSSSAVFMVK